MTKAKKGYCPPTCSDCAEWERMVEMEEFGRCSNEESDHYGHIISREHPACRKIYKHTFRSRKNATGNWAWRKQQAGKAKDVKPLPERND